MMFLKPWQPLVWNQIMSSKNTIFILDTHKVILVDENDEGIDRIVNFGIFKTGEDAARVMEVYAGKKYEVVYTSVPGLKERFGYEFKELEKHL